MAAELVHVTVSPSTCVGSRTCIGLAPAHFRMTDDGVAAPIESPTAADDDLQDAVDSCPVQAITTTPVSAP